MKNSFFPVRMDEQNPHWPMAISRKGTLYHRPDDFRTEFGRDYTRIIHSTAYSRLKHKTQVLRLRTITYVHALNTSTKSLL